MKSKMTTVFAALMIALMAVGFAYAHWEKTITIDGTVKTGTFHLSPSFEAYTDDDKESCTVEWDIDDNTVIVTVDNAYPCITVYGTFDIHNDGTVPAGLADVRIETDPELTYEWNPDEECYEVYEGELLIANLYLTWDYWEEQIDPGDTVYIDFELHFKEGLPQDATYTFTIEFEYWNWNEVPPK